MGNRYTVNGIGTSLFPWAAILTAGAAGLTIRRVEISYFKNNTANNLEGTANLFRCSTPTPGSAVTVVPVIDQSPVSPQSSAMSGDYTISTPMASMTSWSVSNTESIERNFEGEQGITVNPGDSIGVLVSDGVNGGEFSVNIWIEE
jgi:hypothetical protein